MIDSFSGEFSFLSNFNLTKIKYRDIVFASSENAYQFAKMDLESVTEEFEKLFAVCSPGQSKYHGRKVDMRSDWDNVKQQIMEDILRIKFSIPEMNYLLLATGTEELVEGNYWNDTYWGVCNGKGSNHLGKILMKIRKDFKQSDIEKLF